MTNIHFDVSNVRGFAENLHHKLVNEYLAEIAQIKELLGNSNKIDVLASTHKPMGNVDANYYGRDIAEVQAENVAAFVEWLDSVERSIRAVINAGLYMADEMNSSDAITAADIDRFFEKPTFGDMDYLDPSSHYPGR